MNRFSTLVAAGVLAAASGIAPGIASAALITFDFTADFSSASTDLIGAGFSSSTLSGSYTFDDTTADAGVGSYLGSLTALSFSDFSASNTGTATNGDITVINGGTDSYTVFAGTGDGLVGTTNAGGYTLDSFTLILADYSGTGFTDDSLPGTPPALTAFTDIQSISLGLRFDSFTVNNAIYDITSLTLDPGTGPGPTVPEPATLVLLGLGLAGLGFSRKRGSARTDD